MEESTSERLHLEGHVLLPSSTAEVHSREAGMMNLDTIFSKAVLKVCLPQPIILFAYEVSAPTDAVAKTNI